VVFRAVSTFAPERMFSNPDLRSTWGHGDVAGPSRLPDSDHPDCLIILVAHPAVGEGRVESTLYYPRKPSGTLAESISKRPRHRGCVPDHSNSHLQSSYNTRKHPCFPGRPRNRRAAPASTKAAPNHRYPKTTDPEWVDFPRPTSLHIEGAGREQRFASISTPAHSPGPQSVVVDLHEDERWSYLRPKPRTHPGPTTLPYRPEPRQHTDRRRGKPIGNRSSYFTTSPHRAFCFIRHHPTDLLGSRGCGSVAGN